MTMPVGFRESMRDLSVETVLKETYPEREGFGRRLFRGSRGELVSCHVGYTTDRMSRCECGDWPVLEQTVDDVSGTGRNIPARKFVAICPRCEARTEYDGDIERCIEEWNAGRFTADSMMLKHSMKNRDLEGFARLAGKVISLAYDDAVALVREKHRLRKKMDNPLIGSAERTSCRMQIENINGELARLQKFFEESPLMMGRDPDSVISDIRKEVYPTLRPEMRMRKSLILTRI